MSTNLLTTLATNSTAEGAETADADAGATGLAVIALNEAVAARRFADNADAGAWPVTADTELRCEVTVELDATVLVVAAAVGTPKCVDVGAKFFPAAASGVAGRVCADPTGGTTGPAVVVGVFPDCAAGVADTASAGISVASGEPVEVWKDPFIEPVLTEPEGVDPEPAPADVAAAGDMSAAGALAPAAGAIAVESPGREPTDADPGSDPPGSLPSVAFDWLPAVVGPSASATPVPLVTNTPTPSATARAPTRPMYFANPTAVDEAAVGITPNPGHAVRGRSRSVGSPERVSTFADARTRRFLIVPPEVAGPAEG